MKKIALYGGTFDPIHNGHLAIAKYVKEKYEIDKFFWVPVGTTPVKKRFKVSPAKNRLEMLRLAIDPTDEISTFEIDREQVSFTKDTVAYFRKRFSDAEIYLVIGSDHLSKLNKWKEIEWIARNTQIVVARRSPTFSRLNIKRYKCQLMNNEILQYSSTDARLGNYRFIPDKVQEYLASEFLYLQDFMRRAVSIKRSKHSFATAELAGQYAKNNGIEWRRGFYAGLMHDVTKEWTHLMHEDLIFKYSKPSKNLSNHQLHQLSASLWFEHVYKNKDKEIIKAIANHTTLENLPITLMDKIVFTADKLAEGRKFEGIQLVRKIALENLEKGFKIILKKYIESMKQKNEFSKNSQNYYEGIINGK